MLYSVTITIPGRRGWAGTVVSGVETGSVLSLDLAGNKLKAAFSQRFIIMVLGKIRS
jgi:hypothetical protein